MQPKLLYLAERREDMDRAAFVSRWRQHGALGMSRPRWMNIARYVHCDVLDEAASLTGICNDFDGVGLIWHRSPAHRAAHRADASSQNEMELDERETFAKPVAQCCLVAAEKEVFSRTPGDPSPVKLFRFLKARAGVEQDRFLAAVARAGLALKDELAGATALPVRYVLNQPLDPRAEGRDAWGLDSDCVEEYWFDGLDSLGAFVGLARRNFVEEVDRCISIVTNEIVLHDLRR